MSQKLNGVALSSIAAGTVLMWSGVKGWAVLATLGDIISGKKPSGGESYALVSNVSSSGGSGNFASGGLASIGMSYQGHAYRYGGSPGKSGANPWDCSSMWNWIVSVKLGKAIPGYGAGKYDGTSHGPPTGSWGVWNGLKHISASELQANDFIVWTGHMGVATSNTHMISALDSKDGTIETPIAGNGNGPLMCYGRLL